MGIDERCGGETEFIPSGLQSFRRDANTCIAFSKRPAQWSNSTRRINSWKFCGFNNATDRRTFAGDLCFAVNSFAIMDRLVYKLLIGYCLIFPKLPLLNGNPRAAMRRRIGSLPSVNERIFFEWNPRTIWWSKQSSVDYRSNTIDLSVIVVLRSWMTTKLASTSRLQLNDTFVLF